MNKNIDRTKLRRFFIKLIAITFALIIVINTTYNLIFADKLENINKFLSLNKKENREFIKQKLRAEIQDGLNKDYILYEEDKMLLYELFLRAYTFKSTDVRVRPIENKRFTMRDIGRLEKRIENVEYYTQLSLLESEAKNMQIQDAVF